MPAKPFFSKALPLSLNWVILTAFDALGFFFPLSVHMKTERQHNLILQDLLFNHQGGSSGYRKLTLFSQVEIDVGQVILRIWIRYFCLSGWTSSFIFLLRGTSVPPMSHRWFEETKCGQRSFSQLTEFYQQNSSWWSELVSRYNCVRCLNSFCKRKWDNYQGLRM